MRGKIFFRGPAVSIRQHCCTSNYSTDFAQSAVIIFSMLTSVFGPSLVAIVFWIIVHLHCLKISFIYGPVVIWMVCKFKLYLWQKETFAKASLKDKLICPPTLSQKKKKNSGVTKQKVIRASMCLELGMSRSSFFALESESLNFEYLQIPKPDPILLYIKKRRRKSKETDPGFSQSIVWYK